ncbi:prickle-like protein 4 isoform X3 [Ochotona princeps]|uniref:prickle-like protein 4 isoform X3 n=1 Tax=Ochotona princeps TaxID=9978 RepID=UPI0027153C17|nr:prickle-like protein 4 isoform X3 [Ochotona princeps]
MSEASLMSGEPGLPVVSWDSDLDQLPGPDPEDHPGAVPEALSSGPPGLDTHQACSWPELRTLLQQLPPQDSDERYCLALGKEEQAELQLFHAQRKQEALGQGVARLVPPQLEGYTCEKLIFSRRCTEAEGRHWHENHFCCQDCAGPLCGGRYALPGGSPCCPSCFESRYLDAGSSRALEGLATLGEAGPDGSKRRDRTSLDALSSHGAAFLAASSSLDAQQGLQGSCPEKPQSRIGAEAEEPPKLGQDRLEMPRDPKEDAPCSTCSSSSDSEPEGFFFGQPLPRSRNAPGRPEARDDTPRKRCTLS